MSAAGATFFRAGVVSLYNGTFPTSASHSPRGPADGVSTEADRADDVAAPIADMTARKVGDG
jgi:hypothetical protein